MKVVIVTYSMCRHVRKKSCNTDSGQILHYLEEANIRWTKSHEIKILHITASKNVNSPCGATCKTNLVFLVSGG